MSTSTTAIAKYESGKKEIAKHRAEKRLATLKTVDEQVFANRPMFLLMILNAATLGGYLGWLVEELRWVSLGLENAFGLYCVSYFIIPFLVFNQFFMVWLNRRSLIGRFKSEEMKRLNAEDEGLASARKRLMQHPDNAELRVAYDDLVGSIRRSRQEDEDE